MDKNENGPVNLYKSTILGKKLAETIEELRKQGQIPEDLEHKINAKFDEIICDEIKNMSKTKNTIKGKVTQFRNCDDIWIFYCKDINMKLDKLNLSVAKLKIIAVDEKLKSKKNNNKYAYNNIEDS